ncbi:MAG: PDZ domain-containing protein [Planctomycetales bacterium]|nr:PDZ domain-containing protein [Planctomycetales bacterium]
MRIRPHITRFTLLTAALLCACVARWGRANDGPVVDELALKEQQALAAAVERVAPAVVQIRTIGGLERVDDTVLAQGPTTGLIVRDDGYIVSSAINFAQQPASTLVRLADGTQHPAEIVGRDHNRMLVLLKIDVDEPLTAPVATPLADIRVGQRAAAVGRTFVASRVNISTGVVSALGRMNGRVLQTDAKASAANYGGPLVDLSGRVMGVLVPMAPQMSSSAEEPSEVAGAEYYDSGIAFAVPLEHVLSVLPRWIDQGDLKRGLLGIGLAAGSPYATEPRITTIWPRSPAAEAGWQAKDLITAIDGQPVVSQTQLRRQIVPHYAGDQVAVTLQRGEGDDAETLETEVTLAAKLPTYQQAFLGVLPQRASSQSESNAKAKADAEQGEAGVIVRAVWPDSPAAAAGLVAGDRLTRIGDEPVASTAEAVKVLAAATAGEETTIAFVHDGEEIEHTIVADTLPTAVLNKSDLPAATARRSEESAATTADNGERALADLKLPEFGQVARVLEPAESGAAPGLILWLGSADAEINERLIRSWTSVVDGDRVVFVVAPPSDAAGWTGGDLEYLDRLLPAAVAQYGADVRRTIVAGEGKAGQLAFAMALKSRGRLAGVAAVGAPLPRTLVVPDNAPGAPLAVLTIATENSPFSVLVNRDARRLLDAGYPVSQAARRGAPSHNGLLNSATRSVIARWLDGLDRF